MAIWLVRAGKFGEHETKFMEESTIYCTWDGIDWDMAAFEDRIQFKARVRQTYPDDKEGSLNASVGQLWAFSHRIAVGDIVALPSKIKPVILFGEVKSDCHYNAEANVFYRHSRKVKWIKEINRSNIDQDLLFSLGSVLGIFPRQLNIAKIVPLLLVH